MKKIVYATCLFLSSIYGFAQKLPDIQNTGVVAPVGIKIDGKSTEWNDTFSAENKRTEILYTLANDDKNLYLVVKSANAAAANKIMMGGLSFTINTQAKKRDKEAYTITYPLVPRANRNQGGRNGQGGQGGQMRMGGQAAGAQGGFQNRPQQTQQQRDSAMLVQRKTQLATVKEIKIAGFKNIPDSLISIYNEYGLKAVASFDQSGNFIYELAIPLNLLELTSSGTELAYQIKLNGMSAMGFGGPSGGNFGGGGNRGGNIGQGGGRTFGGGGNGQDLMIATDFWGKYTLVKK